MAFNSDLVTNESEGTRRASATSFEAWLPQFPGLYKPRGLDLLMAFDEFVFKTPRGRTGSCIKDSLNLMETIEVHGNELQKILVANRKRNISHPFRPPISVMDLDNARVLKISSLKGCKCLWDTGEVEIVSSSGSIGIIRLSTSHGVKTYEVYDSYSQLTFYVTPNLAPHQGLQLLILGSERSFLTAAVFERLNDYTLEIFKPLSPILKALLVSITLHVIQNHGFSS